MWSSSDCRKDHGLRPRVGRGCDGNKDHAIVFGIFMFVVWKCSRSVSQSMGRVSLEYNHSMMDIYCCIVINWLNIMILFAIMFMLVVSLQVHSMY